MVDINHIYLKEKKKYIGSEILSTSSLYSPNSETVLNYIKKSYFHNQFTNRGPLVEQLEEKLLKFHNTKYCITFCSGFWALVAAIKNVAQTNKKYILMPSLTYRRLADAVLWAGFTPLYCDIDPINLGLDINSIDPNKLENTSLILAVHPLVDCLNAYAISQFALSKSIPVVFDSVESVNEFLPDGKIGEFGNCEIFSLHASKLINGLEGGYITTNDSKLCDQFRKFQKFSFNSDGELTEKYSMNAKLNEGHAAFALASLDELDLLIKHNYVIYQEYLSSERFVSEKLFIRRYNKKFRPAYKIILAELNPKYIDCRDELIRILNSIDILSRTYYFPPLHTKRKSLIATKCLKLKNTDIYSKNLLLLPSGWQIKKNQVSPIMKLINKIIDDIYFKKNGR
ncbi:aminotransferase class I/II-fold pyridoxal phosphate-dependent enzyme [Prochlorococcus marinus]|uniref:aminotransferase class I/II-fold pyridoxal phosphate-dependent enzyme n=1 Tax=Prochlorococcus marinus TaxID=1219 RepID=UPI0022B3B9E2|nr:aminotransferase class I/II-fold pyridoxal phosphate-dependent enzyme [Prochlorococcus marinus]